MVYAFAIFLNFQTNISKLLIIWISQSKIFVLGISLGYLHSVLPRAALGALRPLRTRVATAFFAPPKLPQQLVHLVGVVSLLARRVSCICQPIWELAAPVLTELVWEIGMVGVGLPSRRNKGIKGTRG